MEASLRSLKVQKPLSECSNTAAASTQSSTASTGDIKFHKSAAVSSPGSPAPSTPQLSVTGNYEIPEPSSVYSRKQSAAKRKSAGKENDVRFSCPRNVGKRAKQDGLGVQFKIDTTPIASTPTPRVASSIYDAIYCHVCEPHSVYDRRKTAQKRKSNRKENIGASSCPPAIKIQNTGDKSNEDEQNCLAKKSKAPCKQRVLPANKGTSGYSSPELEKQKTYFAELDEYELEEAEESELDE